MECPLKENFKMDQSTTKNIAAQIYSDESNKTGKG